MMFDKYVRSFINSNQMDELFFETRVEVKKTELKAYCNSIYCAEKNKNSKIKDLKLGQEKFVHKSFDFCPDCGSALFWYWKSYKYESKKTSDNKDIYL